MNKIRYYKNGDDVRTLKSSGNINMYEYVKIVEELSDDKDEKYLVKSSDGRESVFNISDLHCFGADRFNRSVFDILNPIMFNNCLIANVRFHITENVRSCDEYPSVLPKLLYTNLNEEVKYFKYEYREINDDEAVEILLNDILYNKEPLLQYCESFIENDKYVIEKYNKKGYYVLANENRYKISCNESFVSIKDEIKEIYYGKIDKKRLNEAIIKKEVLKKFSDPEKLIEEYPNFFIEVYNKVKKDKYESNKN